MEAPDTSLQLAHALDAWQRLGLRVRLALYPERPCAIGCYVAMGRHMSRRGLVDEVEAELRMFRLLLQSGTDLALPWAWRQHCLSFATHPLARLALLHGEVDPDAVLALQSRWELARQQLPAG